MHACAHAYALHSLRQVRSSSEVCSSLSAGCLQGSQLGSWAADTGAQEGDEIALRGIGGKVHVLRIPASTAAGSKAASSPSPAPAAAEANRGGRGSKRGSHEPQQERGAASGQAAIAEADRSGRGSKRASREPQASEPAAKQVAAPAGGGGGGRGSKQPSQELQQERGRGAAAAGDAEQFFASGEKGWQLGADGWWRRALTASACGNTKRGKGSVKLGFSGVHVTLRLVRAYKDACQACAQYGGAGARSLSVLPLGVGIARVHSCSTSQRRVAGAHCSAC